MSEVFNFASRLVILDELTIVEFDYDSSVYVGHFREDLFVRDAVMFPDNYSIREIIFL